MGGFIQQQSQRIAGGAGGGMLGEFVGNTAGSIGDLAGSTMTTDPFENGKNAIQRLDPTVQTMNAVNNMADKLGMDHPYSDQMIEGFVNTANAVGAAIAIYYAASELFGPEAAGESAATGVPVEEVAAGGGALSGAADGGSTTTTTPTTTPSTTPTTPSGGMPTTNPVTGQPQQSGTGTFGTGQGATNTTSNAGFWDSAGNWITSPQGIGTMANLAGGVIQGQQSQQAMEDQAAAQLAASQQAAELARFRPVGVTTGFGASQFEYDPSGRLVGAGYQLTPEMQRQRDALISQSGGLLNQAGKARQATAPMGQAAQSMFKLGQGYLATTPQQQAAKYMRDQQALLSTSRNRQLSSLQNTLQQQGRLGLATGATGMMGAANPELEAFYNAQRQQDLGLAAQATQGGMDYAKFGAGMVGLGGTTLQDMYRTQSAAYQPYQTALGGAQSVEQLGQGAMNIGTSLGQQVSTAGATQGGFLTSGQQTAGQYQVPAQSYNPYASVLGGIGQSMNQYGSNNQNQWGF